MTFTITRNSLLYVFRIILGCLICWWLGKALHVQNQVWAFISVIIVSEPDYDNLKTNTITRSVNTVIGCLIGVLFLALMGAHFLSMMIAITLSILLTTSFPKYPSSWKMAPVTVAIVMIPAIQQHADLHMSLKIALDRTEDVLLGCVVRTIFKPACPLKKLTK